MLSFDASAIFFRPRLLKVSSAVNDAQSMHPLSAQLKACVLAKSRVLKHAVIKLHKHVNESLPSFIKADH